MEGEELLTHELVRMMQDFGQLECEEEADRREAVLCELDLIAKEWVKRVARNQGRDTGNCNAKVCPFGSYSLMVYGPHSDIDALCIGPCYAYRDEHFFGTFVDMLSSMPEITNISTIPTAYVPIIKFKFNGINVDLSYARLGRWVVPESLNFCDKSIFDGVSEDTTIRSLLGPQVAQQILGLVPCIQTFRTVLRCIRYWAKRRGLASNMLGFLSGVSCALLVARVCQKYPNAMAGSLVARFFDVLSEWKWPDPVMICDVQDWGLGLPAWKPDNNNDEVMPIITPAYPPDNCGRNVSFSTLDILIKEFVRGKRICHKVEANEAKWEAIFEPYQFFAAYKYYLQISLAAKDEIDLDNWKGWVQSRLRQLVAKIEMASNCLLLCHPHLHDIVDPSRKEAHCYFFVGLRADSRNIRLLESGQDYFCLSRVARDWTRVVEMYRNVNRDMFLSISKVPSENLPAFVLLENEEHIASSPSECKELYESILLVGQLLQKGNL